MSITRDTRINLVNIGLMIISCIAAFIMPFEVFLFAYAFLGPLHYLTEISWLHDRKYFAKGKYDFLVLLGIGVVIAIGAILNDVKPEEGTTLNNFLAWYYENQIYGKLIFLALFGAIILAFVKNPIVKIVTLLIVFLFANGFFLHDSEYVDREGITHSYKKETMSVFVITSLLPTLIHVYIFTGLFMLFGALKSRSKSGLWSVFVFVVCPILLFILFRENPTFVNVSQYGKDAYYGKGDGFWDLNVSILKKIGGLEFPPLLDSATKQPLIYATGESTIESKAALHIIFTSKAGVLLQRFIAFAYLYHYLNWFSKTEIIRWHQVPKARFIGVIILYLIAVGCYIYDYSLGLQVLFFLSFCHVLLEFPLNWTSIVGIFKESGSIFKNGFNLPVPKK